MLLVDGIPWVYIERGGTSLATFESSSVDWAPALAAAVDAGSLGDLEIGSIDGEPIGESACSEDLIAAGFTRGYKGLVRRHRGR